MSNAEPRLQGREGAVRRSLVTPEGVPITLELAERGERAGAFLIDMVIMIVATVVTMLAAGSALHLTGEGDWVVALFFLLFFLLRQGYFFGFELAWQGRTPGKRLLGLKVVDRHGGTLSLGALAGRNMLREVEVFMPLGFLMMPVSQGVSGWINLLCMVWAGILLLMPLFNRDRLRLGDMVAGTWVITTGRTSLQQDLAVSPSQRRRVGRREPPVAALAPAERQNRFSERQLDIYGVKELQVLESVLRIDDGPAARETLREVAQRIRAKIGWQGPAGDDRAFLDDYYAALRAHLERHMLFGDRRADKHVMEVRRAGRR